MDKQAVQKWLAHRHAHTDTPTKVRSNLLAKGYPLAVLPSPKALGRRRCLERKLSRPDVVYTAELQAGLKAFVEAPPVPVHVYKDHVVHSPYPV